MAEHHEQAALIKWCDTKGDPYNLIFAIPNGGHRHLFVAKKLKAEGVRPGVPDLMLPVPVGKYNGLFIEMKDKDNGSLTQNQDKWLTALIKQGYCCEVCWGWENAREIIKGYLYDG